MVGASPAVVEPVGRAAAEHAELTELLHAFPVGAFTPPGERIGWLLDVAVELDRLGFEQAADTARDRAVWIVRAVIGMVAGSDGR